MSGYAEGTSVSVEKSMSELRTLISRYGADRFGTMDEASKVHVLFEVRGRRVVFVLDLPNRSDEKFKLTASRKWARSEADQYKAWEQACREKWRALVLVVKAKLEAVHSGITTFEDEFAMHFIMPDGRRLRDTLLPALDDVLSRGKLPAMLGLPETTS